MPKTASKKVEKPKLLVLLASHAIIHRAYHALPEFSNSKGEPTGALYGIATMLMKIVTDLKPDYIVATYDLPEKTFRHEAYDDYKAGRAKADDALVKQLVSSRKLFEAFGIPMYDKPGFEADDMLGTIVAQVEDSKSKTGNLNIIIASGDMDTLQLVKDKKVQVFTLKKGINDTILYDEDAVQTRFGFGPELLPDYKGLRGDPSDNIIGIAGIGEKTATTLIQTFGSIEQIYKALKNSKTKPKFKDAGVTERIIKLLEEGEEEALFSKTLATIRRDAPITFTLPTKTFREGLESERIIALFKELEFRSLVTRLEKVFSITPIAPVVGESEVDEVRLRKARLALWLLDSDRTNITLADILDYTKKDSFEEAEHELTKILTEKKLLYVYNDIECAIILTILEMTKWGIKVDSTYLKKLSVEYHAELEILRKEIYTSAGHEFNINSPQQLGVVLFDELKIGEGKGVRMKKTEGGARSTRESELMKLREHHPIVDKIFAYRELQKLLSTYIDTIPLLIGTDGRVHATFNQAGAATGRFSSDNPNLQNIPIRSESGKKIRNAFVADKGYKLVSFDYSQIELRIAALMSEDTFMIKVFKEGKDIHAAVASRVFGVGESEVTPEMRRRAKIINFGILYGMGVNALRENLGTDRKDAEVFYQNYFAEFPTIQNYLEGVKKNAYAQGFTETLFGRRRYFPGLKSSMPFVRAMAERMAINAPIQGTAADCIKIAMRDVTNMLEREKLTESVHLVLQVHDELVYEIEDKDVTRASALIEKAMGQVIPQDFLLHRVPVPLEVHVAVGKNWGELK